MLLFVIFAGKALQCASQAGCVPVPIEAINEMIKLGILELILEVGIYKYYRKKTRKDNDDE